MYLAEAYRMYRLAVHLVEKEGFEVLHLHQLSSEGYEVSQFHQRTGEIWLERSGKRTSTVIRFAHRGFDWKNQLKQAVEHVFQQAGAMRRKFEKRQVELHNVYVAEYAPVDEWEELKGPLKLKQHPQLQMNVYYISAEEKMEETSRLFSAVDASLPKNPVDTPVSEEEMEEDVRKYRIYLADSLAKRQEAAEQLFTFGKPFFTYILLAVNLLVFFLLERNGSSTSVEDLIDFGAKYNPAIIADGEWWRIITSMFLHIGFLHLFMNMLAVYYIGSLVERIFGSFRFIVIYFLAGIGGGLASFAFSANVSAGASGALFGLFGALLFFGLLHKRIFFQTMGMNVLVLIGINIVFGFSIQQIDNAAHLGGLFAGFIAAGVCNMPKRRKLGKQLIAAIVYAASLYGLVHYGIEQNRSSQSYHLILIEEHLQQEDYQQVVESANVGLDLEGDMDAALLFQRSYAYIEMGETELALEDLERSIEAENTLPEAYYNLALLYYGDGRISEAEHMIETAYRLRPEDSSFRELYEEITGDAPD
ncbi:rhomboid family intramembrane serine protease [Lentibacillus sediminis]|uniref:rhomboid family intramembrane serine protease n=1 Tax=Lentibacillus sediminis TaxID=1940529 RepID=UPI000C1C6EA7|nr:rhomboid family intramembrane serine protease [Lentibacillus sediminis]